MPSTSYKIWKSVQRFSVLSTPEDIFLARFNSVADEAPPIWTRLESITGHRLLIIPLASLLVILEQIGGEAIIEDLVKDKIPVGATVVLVFSLPDLELVEELSSLLKGGSNEDEAPRWVAVLKAQADHHLPLGQLEAIGIRESCGTIIIADSSESSIIFNLFHNPLGPNRLGQILETQEKIAEGADNLKQREAWFRRRADPQLPPGQ